MGTAEEVIHGALAGAIGAACMTPLRLGARRAGLVEKMTPQVMEESLAARLNLGHRASQPTHHVADQMMHLGFGAALGATYGLVDTARPRQGTVARGAIFGLLAWGFGAGAVVPLLRAARPPWKAHLVENAVNIAAHLVFGVTTALVMEELSSQSDGGPTSDLYRRLRRVG
jgi:putative membrane protein